MYAMRNPLISLGICLERAFAECRNQGKRPDLIAISGDLCEDGDEEDYRTLRTFIYEKAAGVPVAVTLGNHDSKQSFRAGWLGEEGTQPYNWTQTFGDTCFISLDNSVQGNPNGDFVAGQIEWLRAALAAAGERQTVLMTHHHMIPYQGPVLPVKCSGEFLELIRKSQISCILCGHTHHNFEGLLADKPCFTVDGMSFYGENLDNGAVRFREKFGYSLIVLDQGRVLERRIETFDTGRLLGEFFWK